MNLSLQCGISMRSYGIVGSNLLASLIKQGNSISLFPIGPIECSNEHSQYVKESLDNVINYNPSDTSLKIWHEFDLLSHVGQGWRVGFPFFELDRLPNSYPRFSRTHLENQDLILVSSKWAQNIVNEQVPHHPRIEVVPLGVDPDIFFPANTPNSSTYTFLAAGKWELRKGYDILKTAFDAAFAPKDNVRLRLLAHNPFLSQDECNKWYTYYLSGPLASKIEILPWLPTQHEVADVMRDSDCGIFPSRAEGWNLEYLEMLAVGRPCIGTYYSGHTAYANKLNSTLIEPEEFEEADDGKWFGPKAHNEGRWMKFTKNNFDCLVEGMRYMYNNNVRTNPNGVMTGEKFTWESSARRLLEVI